MNQLRLFGDAFGEGGDGHALRAFLGAARSAGVRCSLALAGIAPRPAGGDRRPVRLDDGWRRVAAASALPPASCAPLFEAVASEVAATAPVVVFAPPGQHADARLLAGLAYPAACAVLLAADAQDPRELLDRVRAEWRWAGVDRQPHAQPERTLRPWLDLPTPSAEARTVVHLASSHSGDGTDLVLTAWRRLGGRAGWRLRLVAAADERAAVAALAADVAGVEVVAGPPCATQLGDAAGWLQPWRVAPPAAVAIAALASGRAVVASRCGELGRILGGASSARPIEGAPTGEGGFAPDPDAVFAGLVWLLDQPDAALATGERGRRRVVAEFVAGRCAPPPPPVASSTSRAPVVAIVAPWFAADAAAGPAIALARALLARGQVQVRLVLAQPADGAVAALRARAPQLLEHLTRHPGAVDLWLASDADADGVDLAAPRLPWPGEGASGAERVEAAAIATKYGCDVARPAASDSSLAAPVVEPLFELPLASRALSPKPTLAR